MTLGAFFLMGTTPKSAGLLAEACDWKSRPTPAFVSKRATGFSDAPGSRERRTFQRLGFGLNLKLWKTILNSCQSATVSRCKWLFCHVFDLFSFTVEPAVNKLVVARWSPLITRLTEVWLFFDQWFRPIFWTCLSTLKQLVFYPVFGVIKPVDNSVCNRWKDRRR
jgi:hypothetical protein